MQRRLPEDAAVAFTTGRQAELVPMSGFPNALASMQAIKERGRNIKNFRSTFSEFIVVVT